MRKTGVAGLEFEAGLGYEWLTQALCLSSCFLSSQDEWVSGWGVEVVVGEWVGGEERGVWGEGGYLARQTQLFFIPATFSAP